MCASRFAVAAIVMLLSILAQPVMAEPEVIGLDNRQTRTFLSQLLRNGRTRIVSEPTCPAASESSLKKPTIADALLGALAREAEGGLPVQFASRCIAVDSGRSLECTLTVNAPTSDVESSSGFTFTADARTEKIDMKSVRCAVTP